MKEFFFLAVIGGYVGYNWYVDRLNEQNRAAETVINDTEKKDLTMIRSTAGKPASMPSRGYISSTFNPVQGNYTPISEISEDKSENEIKVLNVANRFTYG
jgi:hypothetical protein